jgi:Mg2+/Co2+ transporter CorC
LEDLAGLKWKDEDVTTVGGYVVRQFGYLPSRGERLHLNGYSVTVEQTDGRRLQRLRFRREADTPTPTDGNDYLKPGREFGV